MVYKIRSVEIAETDELFGWCEHVTSCSTNLYLEFCQKTPSITMGGDEWLF